MEIKIIVEDKELINLLKNVFNCQKVEQVVEEKKIDDSISPSLQKKLDEVGAKIVDQEVDIKIYQNFTREDLMEVLNDAKKRGVNMSKVREVFTKRGFAKTSEVKESKDFEAIIEEIKGMN